MGACGSKLLLRKRLKKKLKRKRISKPRVLDKIDERGKWDCCCYSHSSTVQVLDHSEIDDDFYSVHDEFDEASTMRVASPRDSLNQKDKNVDARNVQLPCVSSTLSSDDRTRVSITRTSGAKRNLLSKLSFKFKEGHNNPITSLVVSPKVLLQRPKAGSSVSFCPLEKKMPNSWSPIEPSTFRVRGQNYLRDKKKDFAPNSAAYCPFSADVFLSPRKIDHIARFVELPIMNSSEEFPSILVVNVQIPLYPAAIFQGENDGEGMSLVLYFKLSESFSKDLPAHFQENINRIINDEVETVKGFALDTISPFRDRLKILVRLTNGEDLHLSTTEKKILNTYNEKPVLSCPQHEFYLGEKYFEIDLDMHRFSYLSRKTFFSFQDRFKLCELDFGLTIQENKAENLPENMLCCIRLNEIDYSKYCQLGI